MIAIILVGLLQYNIFLGSYCDNGLYISEDAITKEVDSIENYEYLSYAEAIKRIIRRTSFESPIIEGKGLGEDFLVIITAKIVVDDKGVVESVFSKSDKTDMLNDLFDKSIKQWRFKPLIKNGMEIPFVTNIECHLIRCPNDKYSICWRFKEPN